MGFNKECFCHDKISNEYLVIWGIGSNSTSSSFIASLDKNKTNGNYVFRQTIEKTNIATSS